VKLDDLASVGEAVAMKREEANSLEDQAERLESKAGDLRSEAEQLRDEAAKEEKNLISGEMEKDIQAWIKIARRKCSGAVIGALERIADGEQDVGDFALAKCFENEFVAILP